MVLFRKINQTGRVAITNLFRTKPEYEGTKPYLTNWKMGLVGVTTTSIWVWYNSSTCPACGRRKLDMFRPQLRENSSKALFSMLSYLVEDQQEMVDKDSISYKEKLTKLTMEIFLDEKKMVEKNTH